MPQTPSTITVVAGLMHHDGMLLICQRRRDGAFPLQWEFPGGKIEPGETAAAGLRRELREELSIEAEIGAELYRTRHTYSDAFAVELVFYHVRTVRGLLRNQAFEQVCWESPARLPTFDFLDGDAELITLLSQHKLTVPQTFFPSDQP